MFLLVNQRR